MQSEILDNRPSFDQIFLEICNVIAKRATCDRRHVGAVITIDNRIVATGYNGSTPGEAHCNEPELYYTCTKCNKKQLTGYPFPRDPALLLCQDQLCRGALKECHGGHIMIGGSCVRTIHAEINALLQCAHMGIQLRGSNPKLYCNTNPCLSCLRAAISAGINTIIYSEVYRPNPEGERLVTELPHVKLIYMPLDKTEGG